MASTEKLSHTSALILQMVADGVSYGFDIMDATGLPSGTIYPALRRLEESGLITSSWEKNSKALAENRPARKYYRVSAVGRSTLKAATERYPLLRRLTSAAGPKDQSLKGME